MTIVAYISGHGFGHAVRSIEVLRALRARRPDIQVAIRSPVPRAFFALGLAGRFRYGRCQLDIGAVQRDSLTVDPEASLRTYAELAARQESLIAGEVQAIAPLRPALLFADIPALPCDVAARLGVPAVAMTNFSWDWIYADYVRDYPAYVGIVDALRASYGRAALLLRLPLHGDLSAFPRVRDIPLVARRSTQPAALVRKRLKLPVQRTVVLLSFGGIGVDVAVPKLPGIVFIATSAVRLAGQSGSQCRNVTHRELAACALRYEDLVAASDVVMTKPGYGIVADCLANATPMLYTSRGRFAEYPLLVEGIERHLPNAYMSNDDLYAGRWSAALERVLTQPRRKVSIDIGGAAIAAEALLALAGHA